MAAGPCVEPVGDFSHIAEWIRAQIGAFWQVLLHDAIGILVGWALPSKGDQSRFSGTLCDRGL